MVTERRIHPRLEVSLPAQLQTTGLSGWEKVVLINLSAGGAAIRAAAELALQSEVRLRFSLPRCDRPLEALGLVIQSERIPFGDDVPPVRIGLHFLSFAGDGFEAVRRWVWARLD